jgi:formamidopyrimidine-DNA glycosylase
MPELPEVETTLKGIEPHITGQKITNMIIRNSRLRWPITQDLDKIIKNQTVNEITRRGKYLLLKIAHGHLIIHLGMSGSLRIITKETPVQKHDHVDLVFNNQKILRFTDPRRFGAMLWTEDDPKKHLLLKSLGPEPLSTQFTGGYLWKIAQCRKVAIKSLIMNSHIVVGVGNIYASEALFAAGILPTLPANQLTEKRCDLLVKAIKTILRYAIKKGGTTLKDFLQSDGKPGYFKLHLKVYGRGGEPCVHCGTILTEIRQGQRGTVFCSTCQI